jgi:hypothetical protein
MFTERDVQVKQEQYQDLVRQTEAARLVKAVTAKKRATTLFHNIGQWLVGETEPAILRYQQQQHEMDYGPMVQRQR